VLADQPFQCCPVNFCSSVQWTSRTVGAKNTGIKKVKFWMYDQFPLRSPGEDRYTKGKQQIF